MEQVRWARTKLWGRRISLWLGAVSLLTGLSGVSVIEWFQKTIWRIENPSVASIFTSTTFRNVLTWLGFLMILAALLLSVRDRRLIRDLSHALDEKPQTIRELAARLHTKRGRVVEAAASLEARGKLEAKGEVIHKVVSLSIPSAEAVGVPAIVQGPRPGWTASCENATAEGVFGRGVSVGIESDGELARGLRCRVDGPGGPWEGTVSPLTGPPVGTETGKHFPGEFQPKPEEPLAPGEYRARWYGEIEVDDETPEMFLADATFKIGDGGEYFCPKDPSRYRGQVERRGNWFVARLLENDHPTNTEYTVTITDPFNRPHIIPCKTGDFTYPDDYESGEEVWGGLYRFVFSRCVLIVPDYDWDKRRTELPAVDEVTVEIAGVPGWKSRVEGIIPTGDIPLHGLQAKLYGPGGRMAQGKVQAVLRQGDEVVFNQEAPYDDFHLQPNEQPHHSAIIYNPLNPTMRLENGAHELRWIEDYGVSNRLLTEPHVFEIREGQVVPDESGA